MEGSRSFGLVNIPVGVYLATKNTEFSFNQLCTNGHRIRYKKWCPVEEREVVYSEIKNGYEFAKDQYVVLEKQDLETIKLKSTNTIDIKEFVDEKELDPIIIEKSYFILQTIRTKMIRQSPYHINERCWNCRLWSDMLRSFVRSIPSY